MQTTAPESKRIVEEVTETLELSATVYRLRGDTKAATLAMNETMMRVIEKRGLSSNPGENPNHENRIRM